MVQAVFPHPRKVVDNGDSQLVEQSPRSNPGDLQQLRSVRGAATKNDLFPGAYILDRITGAARITNADSPLALNITATAWALVRTSRLLRFIAGRKNARAELTRRPW